MLNRLSGQCGEREMRITKSMLRDAKRKIIEGQAKFCALAAIGGDALWEEHQKRFPHYIGGRPERDMELLRQLLYDDLHKVIPNSLTD